jgi:hypothetical protein
MLGLFATRLEAASITLEWNASLSTDVTGYVVLFGTSPGGYTGRLDVGARTRTTVTGLADGGTYFFTVQAYNAAGMFSDPAGEVAGLAKAQPFPITLAPDMDGDRESDLVVWRPTNGTWYWLSSASSYSTASAGAVQFGNSSMGDVPMTGDIDGDRIADVIVWRASTGTWMWLTSSTNYSVTYMGAKQWGNSSLGDVPILADIDGDEKADLIVWRASTGTWYWLTSSSGYNYTSMGGVQWGSKSLNDIPLVGDFDGDRRADFAVWRPSTGTWYWLNSSNGYSYNGYGARQWGNSSLGDKPLIGDFDGDKRSDIAVWRASTGTWYWLLSSAGYSYASMSGVQWGSQANADKPALMDMDGDGRVDLCVWRPATGTWFWLNSSAGYSYTGYGARQWGSAAAGDIPIVK